MNPRGLLIPKIHLQMQPVRALHGGPYNSVLDSSGVEVYADVVSNTVSMIRFGQGFWH